MREKDYDRERRRTGDKCKRKDNIYYQAGYDNRVGHGSDTWYKAAEPNPRPTSLDRSNKHRVRESSRTGTQSPKGKRARHDSKRSKSGTSTRSINTLHIYPIRGDEQRKLGLDIGKLVTVGEGGAALFGYRQTYLRVDNGISFSSWKATD